MRSRNGAGNIEPANTRARSEERSRPGRDGSASSIAAMVGTRLLIVTFSLPIRRSASAGLKSTSTLRAPNMTPAAIQAKPTRPNAGKTVRITSRVVSSNASNIGPTLALLAWVST